MWRFVCIIAAVMLTGLAPAAQSKTVKKAATGATKTIAGYHIPVTITPFKNTWVYIGCYFGKIKNLTDSAWLDDKSQGTFKGKAKLPPGIYFAVSPQKYLLLNFLWIKSRVFLLMPIPQSLPVLP